MEILDTLIVPVTVGGMPGSIEFGHFGPAAHGKWASHTGYRSFAGAFHGVDRSTLAYGEIAREIAEERYARHKDMAFVVWEEHKEHGWHWVETFNGRFEIKLPHWTEPCIFDALMARGLNRQSFRLGGDGPLRLTSDVWISMTETSKQELKKIFDPLLQPGTRFADQSQLAHELSHNIQEDLFK